LLAASGVAPILVVALLSEVKGKVPVPDIAGGRPGGA